MIHPAMGQRYRYQYTLPGTPNAWYTWDSWIINYPESAVANLKHSMDRLHSVEPGITQTELRWLNRSTNKWEKIHVPGLTKIDHKYALFSED